MTIFSSFGRYRYMRLLFKAGPVGDIFQKLIDELFNGMPNVFIIVDDILIAHFWYAGRQT